MPELSILEPRVLNGVVASFLTDISPTLKGVGLMGTPESDLNPLWEYDVIRGGRDKSAPNSPNAEATRIDHIRHKVMNGSYIYLRDKKQFNPTTLRWLREVGSNEVSRAAGEQAVLQELLDMDNMQKRYIEYAIWQMFTGSLTYDHIGGGSVAIDYNIAAGHKPSVSTNWGADGDDPIGDIQAWKQLSSRDAGVPLTTVFLNNNTMTKFIKLPEVISQLSDRQKARFTEEGIVPRFMGLDWEEYDNGMLSDAGVYTPYIADDQLVMIAPGGNKPWAMRFGPSADHDAPAGTTGTFSKTWREPDPSQLQVLLEKSFIPLLFRPDQVVYAKITT